MSQSTSENFRRYAAALRMRESGGSYSIVNEHGYTGAYQFGKQALIDAGFMDRQGRWTPYAASLGVDSWETFKKNNEAQNTAFQNLSEKNWDYRHYIGQTVGGIPITASGLLAGPHLVGAKKVEEFLDSGGATIPMDGNKTPVTEYLKKFAGYDFAFDADPKTFGGIVGEPTSITRDEARKDSEARILRRDHQAPTSQRSTDPIQSITDRWGTFGGDGWRNGRPALTYGLSQRSGEDRSNPQRTWPDFYGPTRLNSDRSGSFAGGEQFVPGTATSSQPLYETRSLVAPPNGSAVDEDKNKRYLTGRSVQPSGASVFDTGTAAVPFADFGNAHASAGLPNLDDPFGDWNESPQASVPRSPYQSMPSQTGRPLGLVTGEPMPDYPFPPPIWDFPTNSAAASEDQDGWLMRLFPRR